MHRPAQRGARFEVPFPAGPHKDDIHQGDARDCWLMTALSATAKVSPNNIRQSVVDLGDGTYAVQFVYQGVTDFVRVDADLPVSTATSTSPRFAKLGAGGGLWVAIMEKAWAYWRKGENTYASLNGGSMGKPMVTMGAISATPRAAGTSASELLTYIDTQLKAGHAVTIGTLDKTDGTPLVGKHAYMVERVNFVMKYINGMVTKTAVSLTVRNPWGCDGAGSTDADPNDGYVTVPMSKLLQCVRDTSSATF